MFRTTVFVEKALPLRFHCSSTLDEKSPPRNTILEVCCGDGELASLLFAQFRGKIASYHLLDFNRSSLNMAEKHLHAEREQQTAFFHQVDVAEADFLSLTQGKLVDCVLGAGALTQKMLPSREAALKVLDQIVKVLRPNGGMLMLAGLTNHFIHSQDLKQQGFRVSCKYCKDQQIYLAEKNKLKFLFT